MDLANWTRQMHSWRTEGARCRLDRFVFWWFFFFGTKLGLLTSVRQRLRFRLVEKGERHRRAGRPAIETMAPWLDAGQINKYRHMFEFPFAAKIREFPGDEFFSQTTCYTRTGENAPTCRTSVISAGLARPTNPQGWHYDASQCVPAQKVDPGLNGGLRARTFRLMRYRWKRGEV